MSYGLDANVLIHASNVDSSFHQAAQAFLTRCSRKPEPLCLTWGVISAFLRISTHANVFRNPLTPSEASSAVDALLNLRQTKLLVEEPGFWTVYQELAERISPRGKAVPDTHLAALLQFHGVGRLFTSDRDFRKFDHLETVDPFH